MLNMINAHNVEVILNEVFRNVADPKAVMQKLFNTMAVDRGIEFADKLRIKALLKQWYKNAYGMEYWGANPAKKAR